MTVLLRPIAANDYWKPVIETDLTSEEIAMIDEGLAEYRADPSSFILLENIEIPLDCLKTL